MRRVCLLVIGLTMGIALGLFAPGAASAEPKQPEVLTAKPSGFWTSTRPAERGHEYRYRMLGLGALVAAATGFGMYRLIKRADADRVRRAR